MIASEEAARYLEECAPWCPHCHAPIEANCEIVTTVRVPEQDARPKMHAEWRCKRCAQRWTEVYILESVCWVENRNVLVGAKA